MGRMIDVDKLGLTDFEIIMCGGDYKEALKMLIEKIENAPTVDAVPVVRCKECKYWEYDVIFSDGWCRGKHQGNPNWFCADGERRKDA